jgi:hypothetical protein
MTTTQKINKVGPNVQYKHNSKAFDDMVIRSKNESFDGV